SSYQEWAEGMGEYAKGEEVGKELEYWVEQGRRGGEGAEGGGVGKLPRDYEGVEEGENRVETQRSVVVWVGEEETRELLQGVPEVYHTQVNDVLLTALWRVCEEWSGEKRVMVDLEGHGREE